MITNFSPGILVFFPFFDIIYDPVILSSHPDIAKAVRHYIQDIYTLQFFERFQIIGIELRKILPREEEIKQE
jgi:hypothetical protein